MAKENQDLTSCRRDATAIQLLYLSAELPSRRHSYPAVSYYSYRPSYIVNLVYAGGMAPAPPLLDVDAWYKSLC